MSTIIFLTISFGIAGPAFYFTKPEAPPAFQILLLVIGSYAPAIGAGAALIFARNHADSIAFKHRLAIWRVPFPLYLEALITPSIAWLVAAITNGILGNSQSFQWASLLTFPIIFITNWGEEVGWRGFALPTLLPRLQPLGASLILGVIWGLFHMPLYWQRPLFATVFMLTTPALAIIIARLFLATHESVALCTLFHAVYNSWAQALMPSQGGEGLLLIVAGVVWAIALYFVTRYGATLISKDTYEERLGAG